MGTLTPGADANRRICIAAGGAALLLAATWLLAPALRTLLQSAPVAAADHAVGSWIRTGSSAAFLEAMRWVSALHGTVELLIWTALIAAVLWVRGRRDALPLLIVTVPGGMLLNVALKHLVQRPRPDLGSALQTLQSYSFPSGHTAGAACLYGFLVVALWTGARTPARRAALAGAAVALVLLIATSRIALGVHYFSDCVASLAEASIWLTLCLRRRRRGPSRQ